MFTMGFGSFNAAEASGWIEVDSNEYQGSGLPLVICVEVYNESGQRNVKAYISTLGGDEEKAKISIPTEVGYAYRAVFRDKYTGSYSTNEINYNSIGRYSIRSRSWDRYEGLHGTLYLQKRKINSNPTLEIDLPIENSYFSKNNLA